MKEVVTKVSEVPRNVIFNSTLEIESRDVSYFTHGFFKYPCRFIPHIPRWAILKYTCKGDNVLDPFAGSGTTLVESVINGRNAFGVDFDKLSQLLCKTKTKILSQDKINKIISIKDFLFKVNNKKSTSKIDLHNLSHWFPKENIAGLNNLKSNIEEIYNQTKDEEIYNFLLVCFASTIRKCSYAEETSPKPYISSRFKREPLEPKKVFLKTLDNYITNISGTSFGTLGDSKVVGDDARNIEVKNLGKLMDLVITSPPYINAFDYVRSLRLENAWLNFYGDSNILSIKKKQIGTENISSDIYKKELEKTGLDKLDKLLYKVYKKDKKRAFVVLNFFKDMGKNLESIHKLLKPGGHYIIVIGNSRIRGINIPTNEILVDLANKKGYKLENLFSYIIKNRYLRIPRNGKGGLIKKDWVIDLIKKDG